MCSKFQIYRRDRVGKEGGGVLIAVSTLFPSEEIILNEVHDIEFIATCVKTKLKTIFITCSYIPPASSIQIYERHSTAIKLVVNLSKPDDLIIVLGDFNIPNIIWSKTPDSSFLSPSINSESSLDFIDSIAELALFQINSIPNLYGKTLDLVFVDRPDEFKIQRIDPLSTPEDVYHPTLEISSNINMQITAKLVPKEEKVFDFRKADFSKLNRLLSSENWFDYDSHKNLSPYNIDLILNNFYDVLFKCFKLSIPMRKLIIPNGPPWNTKQLTTLKNLKNKYYKKYKKSGLSTDYAKYSISRSTFNLANIQCYNNYIFKVKTNFKNNPKSFYQFVNSKRRISGYPSMMKSGDSESSIDSEICDMFADFFSSSYSKKSLNILSNYPYSILEATPIHCPTIHTSTVLLAIRKLKFSDKYGPDGIPSCVLLNCIYPLISPLTYLFNASLSNGYFPDFWKKSYIIPLFKSGNRSNISNYRGIAKLSVIPKLFEQIVTETLSHQVSTFLSPFQHGFKKGRSATTNLLEFTTSVIKSFYAGYQTDTIYTDFSKAFDKISMCIV
ncbi:uncharacterized protein LOC124419723 [Lucilia cuprina]|uniref:uncharacterized protein LOC124419723 n=1 Tax=Lucilia cuprina TaxID=7375 RepID=UPI001F06AE80|nr:uncharacterized protein LOC124419723 [Lucilia cuprina]